MFIVLAQGGPSKRKRTFSFDALSSIKQITTAQFHGQYRKALDKQLAFPEYKTILSDVGHAHLYTERERERERMAY